MSNVDSSQQPYRIKFFAEPAFLNVVQDSVGKDSNVVSVSDAKEEKEAVRLGFTVETVFSFVTIISGLIDIGELSKKIYGWFSKSDSNAVVIQTPFGRYEMRKAAGVTEADVRKFLQAAARLSK